MSLLPAGAEAEPTRPLVSAVIIFLNGERFIREAIESVFSQTYQNWELLLIDDGSTDRSTHITADYAARYGGKVMYLDHPGHQNLGMSAARNLGIKAAKGKYIAFLDCDDIWLPQKLAEQVTLMERHPDVAMVYGRVRVWHSWTGDPDDQTTDSLSDLGVPADVVLQPPLVVPVHLSDDMVTPCPSAALLRREVLVRVGGFEPSFRDLYEDIVCWIKIGLEAPVLAINTCWSYYRQHGESACAMVEQADSMEGAPPYRRRQTFLEWTAAYLRQKGIRNAQVWEALNRQMSPGGHPGRLLIEG